MEVDSLLKKLQEIQLIGSEEWEMVTEEHNRIFPLSNRKIDSLRRKFTMLQRKKIPTGDPRMPPDERRAKHNRYLIREPADMRDADDAS